ncbi:MAG TPA: hypothetical protein VGE01_12300 [Fimbriimonas sp.]
MGKRQLKVVRLLEPEMCLSCRFGKVADVETVDGSVQRMIRCERLDCDNWDTSEPEPIRGLSVRDENW